jgi:hypothetical protein
VFYMIENGNVELICFEIKISGVQYCVIVYFSYLCSAYPKWSRDHHCMSYLLLTEFNLPNIFWSYNLAPYHVTCDMFL